MAWSRDQFQRALSTGRVRPRFLPRVGEPIALQRDYFHRLNIMRADMILTVRQFVVPQLEAAAANASHVASTDDLSLDADIGDDVDKARRRFDAAWPRERMVRIVDSIAKEIPKFNARNLNKVFNTALGTDVQIVGGESWVAHAVAEFTAENIALIRSIPSEFFSDLEKRLTRAVADGMSWQDLAELIEDRYNVTESRARLIAKDQIAKFVGDLNRVRQTDLGITHFRWRTMGDERVRTDETEGAGEGHRERNGAKYLWAAPPNGETPGEPINCRCHAEPVLPEAGEF